MSVERIETLIIGAGQSGLALSHHLGRRGAEHLVLERGDVAQRWRSERWDSLHFQSPNWNMNLPGWPRVVADPHVDPDAFSPLCEVTDYLVRYAAAIRAPIRTRSAVRSLASKPGANGFHVQTDGTLYEARNVVVATGPYHAPRPTPSLACGDVFEMHSTQYRHPAQLPEGAVLVVGSGNSGVQIAEELCGAGRRVFLSVSSHERIRRSYRGKDCIWWLIATGAADATWDGRTGTTLSRLMTGAGGGHDIDLRALAAAGVVLLGRVAAVQDGRIALADDLRDHLAHGDASLDAFERRCDAVDAARGLGLPAPTPVRPMPDPKEVRAPVRTLDLGKERITAVVWANGAQSDFGWIDVPVFGPAPGPKRRPIHLRGASPARGLYFQGLPWLHKWKSAFLFGADEDADHIAQCIVADRGALDRAAAVRASRR